MASGSRRSDRLLAALALALSTSFAGCELTRALRLPGDTFYTFVFENYTEHTLAASFEGGEQPLRPCSVRQGTFAGQPYGTPLELTVHDEMGEVVLRRQIQVASRQDGRPIHVTIGDPTVSPCPGQADGYVLEVRNEGNDAIEVWREGVLVGSVGAEAVARFGPFPGSWEEAAKVTIHASGGRQHSISVTALSVDYDLGEVPQVVYRRR